MAGRRLRFLNRRGRLWGAIVRTGGEAWRACQGCTDLRSSPEAPSVRELSPQATEGEKPPRQRSGGPMRTSAPTGREPVGDTGAFPVRWCSLVSPDLTAYAVPPPSQREALAKTDASKRKRRADTPVRPYILTWVRERRGGPMCPPVSMSLSRSRFVFSKICLILDGFGLGKFRSKPQNFQKF